MNVWLRDGSYPIEVATLTDTAEFQDFSWGHGYEREMPLDTPMKEVADAVLATFPAQEKQSVLVGWAPYDKPGPPFNGGPGFVMPSRSPPPHNIPPHVRESAAHSS
ncbi:MULTISPECIES: hypothetical protein [Streptomyces]|uniref:Uncharacterized protein n=2 Tax=Streptomyces TaxID=1883 RepID=A0ABV9J5D2_9ACTN